MGIIFYEMLVGFPPFWNKNDNSKDVSMKLKNFKKYLSIPKEVKMSKEAKKLIFDFLSDRENRLGKNGISEIKNHIFFKHFDWENIRQIKPPFIPKLFSYDKESFKYRLKRKINLDLYISKEKMNNNNKNIFEIKQEKEKERKYKKIKLNFYDFDFNRELYNLKNKIENNILELIKKEIDNYSKINLKSTNITLEETSTEEIASLKSSGSNKRQKDILSKSHYSTEFKNKYNKCILTNNKNYINKSKSKYGIKKSIKIIPVKNLMNNQNIFYKTMYNSGFRDKSLINKSIRINNVEKEIQKNNKMKSKEKNININTIKISNYQNNNNNKNNEDKRKIKISGKLFMLKKNLGKYLLDQ